jgi:hypothetical protein
MNGTRHHDVAIIGTGQGGKPPAADGTFIAMDLRYRRCLGQDFEGKGRR